MAGTVNWSTAWPKHEWEFKLDCEGDTGDWTPVGIWYEENGTSKMILDMPYSVDDSVTFPCNYMIRKPLPHVNVLIVWNDQVSDSLFPWDDGHIKFVAASPPSNQNLTGSRYWTWSTKGYAKTVSTNEQAAMYGLAIAMQKPLGNYFNDKPYHEGTAWIEIATGQFGFTAAAYLDDQLAPLSACEDYADNGAPVDGYSDANLGILEGNKANGVADGDYRLTNQLQWTSDGISPFDIDNDQRVELPTLDNPALLNHDVRDFNGIVPMEYVLADVLRHTITHEIVHAIAGPAHTNDPLCLMYKYSNNWRRDNYLSDYYRSLLRVHNKKR